MYAVAVDKKQIKKTAAIIIAVAILGAAVVVVGGKFGKGKVENAPIPGETAAEREEFLDALGLEYRQASTVSEVSVPESFDELFERYNAMLLENGFDLSDLKGKSVTKCSYNVTNRPDIGDNVYAVLLVKDGIIVAGHLICADDDNFYPLNQPIAETSTGILP